MLVLTLGLLSLAIFVVVWRVSVRLELRQAPLLGFSLNPSPIGSLCPIAVREAEQRVQ